MEAKVPESVMGEPRFNINLFHINADQTVNALNQIGHEVLKGRYNIGYWAWELPEFPDEWVPAISMLDEIWVPSEFCRQTIAAKADIPVVCIPHSIESISVADPVRSSFDLPEGKVLFLNMFDALSFCLLGLSFYSHSRNNSFKEAAFKYNIQGQQVVMLCRCLLSIRSCL